MTNPDSGGSEVRLIDFARSLLGDSVAGLVDRELRVGDVVVQIDQLRFSNVTTEALPHLERMVRHAANAATAGPFDPLRLLKTSLNAMNDSLDSARVAAQLAQQQLREAAAGRISIGSDLFGQSSRVATPQVELDHLVARCPRLWLHVAQLGQTPMMRPTPGMIDLEFDGVSLSGHVGYEKLLQAVAGQLRCCLRPIREQAPVQGSSPIAVTGRWLPAAIRTPLTVTVDGSAAIVEVGCLAIGRRRLRLPSRLHQRHEFEPLGASATLTSATFDETGLVVEATLPPIRWQLDSRRVKAMLALSASSPRSTATF